MTCNFTFGSFDGMRAKTDTPHWLPALPLGLLQQLYCPVQILATAASLMML